MWSEILFPFLNSVRSKARICLLFLTIHVININFPYEKCQVLSAATGLSSVAAGPFTDG